MTNEITAAGREDEVLIIGVTSPAPAEGLEQHGPGERVKKTVEGLKDDYEKIVGQILAMTENTPEKGALGLKQIQVGLGFSGEGELGFIAKATVGVEASITLTFERA